MVIDQRFGVDHIIILNSRRSMKEQTAEAVIHRIRSNLGTVSPNRIYVRYLTIDLNARSFPKRLGKGILEGGQDKQS
jgi:hypothetical protein